MNASKLLSRIRLTIIIFIILLTLSGITAMPVYTEMQWLMSKDWFRQDSLMGAWLYKVWLGVELMHDDFPFMFYGYDWLAFAHIVIGLAFIGPYRNPAKNKWVIDWAILCCFCVIPLALIMGQLRGIPWFHILIDCSFGIIGLIPLYLVRSWIKKLERGI
ncbi:MAG: hypothetical protein JST82_09130 [Bacteroidetes bacterium]|nr:hypothetical protein [Bacteroidota bacterium]